MKKFPVVVVLGIGLILLCGPAAAIEVIGATPGNGGDSLETTFHFDANNVDFQMTRPDGTPLTQADVPLVYGTNIRIFNGGVDHVSQLGLQVQGADLSGENWTNAAFPMQGKAAIDPALGRFKFSTAAFWQGVGLIDAGRKDTDIPQIAMNESGKAFCVFRQSDGANDRTYANEYTLGAGWQSAGLIDAGAGNDASHPQIAMNESGKAFCVFRQNLVSDYRIYANAYVPGAGWYGADLIDTGAGNLAFNPQIAMNESGKAFCVFRRSIATAHRIYTNEYVPGAGWYGAVTIDAGEGNAAYAPQIAMNESGKAFCVFRQNLVSDYRIYANAYVPGAGWYGADLIDTGAGNLAFNPQIAMNESGKAFCVFRRSIATAHRIYTNEYVPGAGWYGAVTIDAGEGNAAYAPQIAMNESGKAFCVFRQNLVSDYRIYANAYVPGAGWYGAVTISADTGNHAYDPQIAINDSGKAFCVFRSDNRIYANEYIPGAGWYGAVTIDAGALNNAYEPQIAINDSGKAFCVFRQIYNGDNRIYANEYVSGAGWQGAGLIDAGALNDAYEPQIAINDSGKAFCVFRQQHNSDIRIYASEYVPGSGWQGAGLIDAGALNDAYEPQIAINEGGKAFCVFRQQHNGDHRIYANNYLGETPYGSVQVNYYKLSAPVPTPSESKVEITNRKIEPLQGGKVSLQLALAQAGKTSIKIYTLQGRLVKTLSNEYLAAGNYTFDWAALNNGGDLIASGVYIIRVQAPGVDETQKVVVIK
ncbi:T9SS type A sorting domain-containing protein [bacterium]|nr:T9SS type A sorting domain-containing protein [bacterium]